MKTRPIFKCHGGKHYLNSWIIENFPSDYTKYDYLEPFLGGGSVLLNKKISQGMEVINDLDTGIIQIYRALRDEPECFIDRIKKTKYSEHVFKRESGRVDFDDYMEHAINELIVRRMSRGGLKGKFSWSDRERGGEPGDIHAWKTITKQLPTIAKRIKNVYILNKSAVNVIDAFNFENVLVYCDPPYLQDTRVSKLAYGPFEMSMDDHIELAEALLRFRGKVIISGYPSTLYNRLFKDWRCITKEIANHASQQKIKQKKIEVCWMNYT